MSLSPPDGNGRSGQEPEAPLLGRRGGPALRLGTHRVGLKGEPHPKGGHQGQRQLRPWACPQFQVTSGLKPKGVGDAEEGRGP